MTCKRCKPQPTHGFPGIHADPHDQKYYQLLYENNDEWFNGAYPFMILNNLGNCDSKASVPSIFTRQPTYDLIGMTLIQQCLCIWMLGLGLLSM